MTPATASATAGREERLAEVLLAYVEASESGRPLDRAAFLAKHPEFASELTEFFAGRDRVERAAAPLRDAAGPGSSALRRGGAWPLGAPPVRGSRGGAAEPLELGQLGDFQLIREVGRGGMGVVYEALQLSLNRRVALKVLPFAAALDPKSLQRFKNEAQAAAQLHHGNIVPVYAVGCERGVHYYAMQFIDGQSLAAVIEDLRHGSAPRADEDVVSAVARGATIDRNATQIYAPPAVPCVPLPHPAPAADTAPRPVAVTAPESSVRDRQFFRRVAEVGVRAAEALEHAHQLGVVHRDVKPANLLVDLAGHLWVTDFGLALLTGDVGLTMTGELLGTLRYMSPEQTFARRGLVDHRTDVYSLGATLYELATLEPVFTGHDRQELLDQIANHDPRPPRWINRATPVELETIILKALAKAPAERYASAQEMADDLRRFLEDKPILARRPTLADRTWKWARRHRRAVASAVAVLILATIGSLTAFCMVVTEQRKTERAYARIAQEQARTNEAYARIALEHRKTEQAYAGERRRSQEAQRSFQEARQAVDFFTRVAAEELDRPDLADVRKRMLERALTYYKSFRKQHGDEPALARELAANEMKVGTLLRELGAPADAMVSLENARKVLVEFAVGDCPEVKHALKMIRREECAMQGCGLLALLDEPSVQVDLGLTTAQIQRIRQQSDELARERLLECPEFRKLPAAEQRRKLTQMAERNQQAALNALGTLQLARLKQIRLQQRGTEAFHDNEVVNALSLTSRQIVQIARLEAERAKHGVAWARVFENRSLYNPEVSVELVPGLVITPPGQHLIPSSPPAPPAPPSPPVAVSALSVSEPLRQELIKRILRQVLTEEQRKRWKDLTGEPFDSHLESRAPDARPDGAAPIASRRRARSSRPATPPPTPALHPHAPPSREEGDGPTA